jgi:hypothetical protein
MLKITTALMILVASAAAGSAKLGDQTTELKPRPFSNGTIRLFQSDDRVLVMMRIGNGDLVPMVFDTGSDGHSFDHMLVRRDRLKSIGQTVEIDGTTGKRRTLSRYSYPDVSLGGLRVGRIEGVGLEYDRDDAMGIISSEMFVGNLVSLELGRNRARILPRSGADVPTGPATHYKGPLPGIVVKLPDGSTQLADLDTGYNGAISLPVSMMKTVSLMAPPTIVGRFRSIDTQGDVYGAQVRGQIRVGPVVLSDPKVTFLGETINIGLPVIRRMNIVLDPEGKRSWAFDCTNSPRPTC